MAPEPHEPSRKAGGAATPRRPAGSRWDANRSVGHIRILETLGTGGMGEVYVGWDEALERRVALKAIRKRHRMRADVKARFLREARLLSQLDHPNICRIHDYVEREDRDYLVLELVEGETLATALREPPEDRPPLDDPRRLEIAEQIAEALAAAHAKGVVHRDLKPQNVMITPGGTVKVLDFGIARSVETDKGKVEALSTETGGRDSTPDSRRESTTLPPHDATELAIPLERTSAEPGAGAAPNRPGAELEIDSEDETPVSIPLGRRRGTVRSPAGGRLATGSPGPADGAPSPPRPPQPSPPASWTRHGIVLGSPGYLSPEQAQGEPLTTASDMYAFGLLLQELFTGERPYPTGLTHYQLIERAQRGERLPLTGVRSDVAALINRLLDPAPAARPTAVETLARLRWIRDTPRRRLVRGAIALAVVLLILAGLKYTLDLKAARDEARRHQAQADDLIGFMLGDLRDKLSDVGRLELLEDVGDKALTYFESLPVEDQTDDALFRRSTALQQIGEVRIAQGDLPAAMAAFAESERLASELVERDPERGDWRLGLGHSHFWTGNVHWLQGDLRAARTRFEHYDEIARKLVEDEPDNGEWHLEAGYAATNLAAVHQRLGNQEEALDALTRSLEIKRRLVEEEPGDTELKRSLATGLSWHGSLLAERGELSAAAESYRQEEVIRRQLAEAEPENTDARRLLAFNASHRGELSLTLGALAASREAYQEAWALFDALVSHDPENTEWQRSLVVADFHLCELALARGELARAEAALRAGARRLEPLVRKDSSNTRLRREAGRAELLRARLDLQRDRPDRALSHASAARAVTEALLAENPDDTNFIRELGEALLILGRIHERSGARGRATEAWRRGVEVLRPAAEEYSNVHVLAVLSQCLLHLDRHQEARPLADRLLASGYSRPDVRTRLAQLGLDLPAPGSTAPTQAPL